MDIDNYKNRIQVQKTSTTTLNKIFDRIKTRNNTIEKNKRSANVFATRTNNGRKHIDIKEFTGLMFIDMDNCIDGEKIKQLFCGIDHTVATWFSSSGINVHALIKIPISLSIDEYKRRYRAFIKELEPHVTKYAIIDKITSNPTQLAFESYDPNIYINHNATTFYKLEPLPKQKILSPLNIDNVGSDKQAQWVIKLLTENINSINTNGYPQLRGFAIWLGGQVGGNYIDEINARNVLENLINSNTYLNSQSSSGTIKTYHTIAAWGVSEGMKTPIQW